jgi:AcrR family transcriptional regulator
LAGEKPWRQVSMGDIAGAAGVKLSDVYASYPSRFAFWHALVRRTDLAVLSGLDPEEAAGAETIERLHDVLMRRFDALAPDKDALRSMLRGLPADPVLVLCAGPQLMRSMAWSLEAAGVSAGGLDGRVKAKALALIYLDALRVWLADDSPDSARTMARLDRTLHAAQTCLRRLPCPRRPTERPAAA